MNNPHQLGSFSDSCVRVRAFDVCQTAIKNQDYVQREMFETFRRLVVFSNYRSVSLGSPFSSQTLKGGMKYAWIHLSVGCKQNVYFCLSDTPLG